jgi:4-diphosphocytidyl-2-C-methyl-D-erythritol kinase
VGLRVEARAKINLFLAVRSRRADGYHELETVFHSIDLADELVIDESSTLEVACEPALDVCDEDNLVTRAVRELAEDAGIPAAARLHITKRIPEAAGLGGGSADAAGALVGVNRLWGLGWPGARLATVGAAIGADVPFQILGGAALGRGRGEILEPIAPWPGLQVVLALPKQRLSTADVYARCTPGAGGAPVQGVAAAVSARSLKALSELMRNDLTAPAVSLAPEIQVALDAAAEVGVPALMSGSGPTVFALTDDPGQAEAVAAAFTSRGFDVARTALAGRGITPA